MIGQLTMTHSVVTSNATVRHSEGIASWVGRLAPLVIFLTSLLLLLMTIAPTFYFLDSAELAIGAATLGIVHAPGYPLYLMVAHLFTYLPIGDIGYRVNLMSALCLAGTATLLFMTLSMLLKNRAVAASTTFIFTFSYYIWATGVVAEVYAPQLFTIALCTYLLVHLAQNPRQRQRTMLWLGCAIGLAVAAHPSSALLLPGVVLACLTFGIGLRLNILAGMLSILVFASTLLYFPIRFAAEPALNLAGEYRADGSF